MNILAALQANYILLLSKNHNIMATTKASSTFGPGEGDPEHFPFSGCLYINIMNKIIIGFTL